MDALQSKVKSLNGNSYANLFTNGKYTRVYPTAGKSSREFADSLTNFTDARYCVLRFGTRICWAAHTVYERSSTAEIRMRTPRKDEQRSKTIKLKLRLES